MARKKKEEQRPEIDVGQRMENLKVLIDSNRSKEGIAYIYLLYNDIIREKFNKPRLSHQTIREYAITCVNELGQNPESVYPFIKKIEDIIYGGLEPTTNEFQFTLQLFGNLYKEITGKTFSFTV
ncbi:MAG: hypothetical protein EU533_08190 [Promethearchaeota archaeon]|nr:MAG: hypothetical protein EU533_08190 [Candidatus Lokiarchaeota archaeon]